MILPFKPLSNLVSATLGFGGYGRNHIDKYVNLSLISLIMDRPEYSLNVIINLHRVTRVIIDQHYRAKHTDVTDSIILELIKTLDGQSFPVESTRGEFKYFRAEPVFLPDDPGIKPYRLVLVLCMSDDFLGVVNAFRVQGSTE